LGIEPLAEIGDTFQLRNRHTIIDFHLHIIISDPSQDNNKIVTVNFTSWRADKDQSCIVDVNEHSFIKVRSCVDYRRDKLISLENYEHCLRSGDLISHDQIKDSLLRRILDGAAISPHIPLGNRKILVDQGLIDTN